MLALTVYEDKNHLRKLLKAGASGYVLKLATGEELIRAVRLVAAGGIYLDPVLAGKVVDDIVNEDTDTGPGRRRSPDRTGVPGRAPRRARGSATRRSPPSSTSA